MGNWSPGRALAYLAAFLVWVVGFVVVVLRYGGHEEVRDAAQGVQLGVMFAACAVIFWVSVVTDTRRNQRGPFDLDLRVARLLRFWFFLIGGAIPEALRSLRA